VLDLEVGARKRFDNAAASDGLLIAVLSPMIRRSGLPSQECNQVKRRGKMQMGERQEKCLHPADTLLGADDVQAEA
jgi:hypothetical protein